MSEFSNFLIHWHHNHKREFLWRNCPTPYRVWLSEIILQQTKVAQGTAYFQRIFDRFPEIKSLADADEEEILKLWQGLGYYSRARNLHFAAKSIVTNYQGRFPDTYDEIRKLKGVGDYTAAAIASIAFHQPYPAIDGNAYRVMSRVFGIDSPIDTSEGKKTFARLGHNLIDQQQPGPYNEAVMDLGAMVCTPRKPKCNECPVATICYALSANMIEEFPVKRKKKTFRNRYFHYLFVEKEQWIYLQKRTNNDIWKNLYQLPLIETKEAVSPEDLLKSKGIEEILNHNKYSIQKITDERIYLLSHQKLFIRFYHIQLLKELNSTPYIKVDKKDIAIFAIPKPIETFLNNFLKLDIKDNS